MWEHFRFTVDNISKKGTDHDKLCEMQSSISRNLHIFAKFNYNSVNLT